MDIDERSLWLDRDFNETYGGFKTKVDSTETLTSLPYHDNVRRDMLTLLCRSIQERRVVGAIAELGVYHGHTARLFHHYMPERLLYLLDTFNGFPSQDIALEKSKTGFETGSQHFADTSVKLAMKTIQPLNENIRIIKGNFPESATPELKDESFALVHLDADLYGPTKEGLEFFYPRLSSGAMMIVHDYNAWLGARQAVEEFTKSHRIVPIPMPDKSGSCLLVKP
ncbi:MAG: TylF/MycF/NovP-related O-methyltransferase [Salibacteraceae bacterium]